MDCPVCGAPPSNETLVLRGGKRSFTRCSSCLLIRAREESVLDEKAERERYLLHDNTESNAEYAGYLDRYATEILVPRLHPGARLLDFGCGQEAVLGNLLTRKGFSCASYDKFFHPDGEALEGSYDAVVLVEVLEHLHDVGKAFSVLLRLLREDGLLFIRTRLHNGDRDQFLAWWYVQDPTHVAFYAARTMKWVSRRFPLSLSLLQDGRDIVFRKSLVPLF
jgi:SAM-dependent methyltransferase